MNGSRLGSEITSLRKNTSWASFRPTSATPTKNRAGTKSYAGEGLVGLSWALLRAGAHNVIAGLWEVSNASAPQLMDELYMGLRAGEDPASALRKAKLPLVHSNGNYRRHFIGRGSFSTPVP